MLSLKLADWVVGLALLVSGTPLLAHHSFLAEFAQNQPMTVTGVVTKVEWMNPHAYFYLDVKDPSGKVVSWSFETASPSALAMRGWKRDSLNIGDKVTVQGYRAKSGSKLAAARLVLLPDGRKVYSGTMDDGGPDQ
jgi:Family of unknown function (DUF6152)